MCEDAVEGSNRRWATVASCRRKTLNPSCWGKGGHVAQTRLFFIDRLSGVGGVGFRPCKVCRGESRINGAFPLADGKWEMDRSSVMMVAPPVNRGGKATVGTRQERDRLGVVSSQGVRIAPITMPARHDE